MDELSEWFGLSTKETNQKKKKRRRKSSKTEMPSGNSKDDPDVYYSIQQEEERKKLPTQTKSEMTRNIHDLHTQLETFIRYVADQNKKQNEFLTHIIKEMKNDGSLQAKNRHVSQRRSNHSQLDGSTSKDSYGAYTESQNGSPSVPSRESSMKMFRVIDDDKRSGSSTYYKHRDAHNKQGANTSEVKSKSYSTLFGYKICPWLLLILASMTVLSFILQSQHAPMLNQALKNVRKLSGMNSVVYIRSYFQ